MSDASANDFDLLREQEIPELRAWARLYRHARTGAELLSLETGDENKVFGITFRTPPSDSTGVPHILEHAVLCGSAKYPLKEPFVELLKGSLQTFLNAFTYPDKTCYPIASQNLQDFYNLIDVYVDAVFHPRITPQILQQEGWHLELDQADAPLTYKGVVFNEMKGADASPDRVMGEAVQQSLFPDTTYGVDSGGNPRHIPDLTYEQFREFHRTLYHPSNARIFFYGDDDPAERLRLMSEYLRPFEPLEVDSSVALQVPFDAPRRVTRPYQATEGKPLERQAMAAVNWALPEVTDPQEALALNVLEYLLVGTPAAPLRKALIDSGLGEDLTRSGVQLELRQPFFTVGLKGMAEGDADRLETLVLETLRALASGAIEAEAIEAAMNSTEFALRENNTGSFPRGIALMLRALATWLHDRDPIEPLAFEEPLNGLKARLVAGERVFEGLIEQHLLGNPHRTTVVLQPDAEYTARLEAAERERLDAVRATLSDDDLRRIVAETRALKLAQETPDAPQALALIPRLHVDDLPRQNTLIPLAVDEAEGRQLLFHDLFTNGILYLDLGLNLHTLPQELLPYAGLFGRALLEMGTETEDFVRLSQRIDRKTGGIRPQLLTTTVEGSPRAAAWLFLRGKAMAGQADELLAILRDVLLTVNLDNADRFRQMVLEEKAGQEAALIPQGHRVVNRRLRAAFNEADWALEQMDGVAQLAFLRDLAEEVERDWPAVRARLETVRQTLVNSSTMLCNVTLDGDGWRAVEPTLRGFLQGLPSAPAAEVAWTPDRELADEGLTIPAPVNYVGKAVDLAAQGFARDGSTSVITRYLRNGWLWEKVRVQGGAYGGFSLFDTRSGVLSFLSYRDPNLLDTLKVYDESSRYLRELELTEEERQKAIIGAIGDMDLYQLPDAKGYTSMERFLAGVSDEQRQRLRDEVLGTTADQFRAFADTLDAILPTGRVVVLGSPAALEAANEGRDEPLEIVRVL